MTRALRPASTVLAALVAVGFGGGLSHRSHPRGPATSPPAPARAQVHVWRIRYRTHRGLRRSAFVVLPAWYGPKSNPPLPLVISPHGRGVSGRANARLWGDLPAVGSFAVVNPEGQGRRLERYSWGYAGQIADLARMPRIVERGLPWLRVDRRRIYAFGGSMGGQEVLLLVARHPRLLAGAAAFDAVTDLALQYRDFPRIACNRTCRGRWAGPIGVGLQGLARAEVGGSPGSAPLAFARRSPLTYARRLAFSGVRLELWWSRVDRIVIDQALHSRKLYGRIRRLNPRAPVQAFVGLWQHSAEMRAGSRLPMALASFGLLPASFVLLPLAYRSVLPPG